MKRRRMRCGLCDRWVEDWEDHVRGAEHRAHLADEPLVRAVRLVSQGTIKQAVTAAFVRSVVQEEGLPAEVPSIKKG